MYIYDIYVYIYDIYVYIYIIYMYIDLIYISYIYTYMSYLYTYIYISILTQSSLSSIHIHFSAVERKKMPIISL